KDPEPFLRFALAQIERRQKPQDRGAAWNRQQAGGVEKIGEADSNGFVWVARHILDARSELDAEHQAQPADLANHTWAFLRQIQQCSSEIISDVPRISSQLFLFDDFQNPESYRASQRRSPEGRAMGARR